MPRSSSYVCRWSWIHPFESIISFSYSSEDLTLVNERISGMPERQEVSHGSSRTLLRCKHNYILFLLKRKHIYIMAIYLICFPCLPSLIRDGFSCSCNLFQGFTAVTDIAGGFSAWRENGLPISRWHRRLLFIFLKLYNLSRRLCCLLFHSCNSVVSSISPQ